MILTPEFTLVRIGAKGVYRIDEDRITDFSKNLKTYQRSPDWNSSGSFEEEEDIPPGWQEETGLFAGERGHVVPYAVPRDVQWILTHDQRPTLIFNQADKAKIVQHRPTLSRFPSSAFTKTPSGEYFSKNPPAAEKQEVVRNPIRFLQQWYDVKFVPDVKKLAQQWKKQNIQFDSEGLGL